MRNENPNPQTFDFYPLRFHFCALEPFAFPSLLSANIFRGAFGHMLRRTSRAAYEQCFCPPRDASGPSGLIDPPRAFAFRTRHLDGQTIGPGESFHVGINLFHSSPDLTSHFAEAFAQMGHLGFGPQRSRARLLDQSVLTPRCSLPLSSSEKVEQVRVEFLTPTELKSDGALAETPQFDVLIRRARDRISTLRALYGSGPLEIDFEALSARALQVHLTRNETRNVKASRHSSRTGQTHPLGGFVGVAEYSGPLTEFMAYLSIASHTGLGRQTVWGKGEVATETLS